VYLEREIQCVASSGCFKCVASSVLHRVCCIQCVASSDCIKCVITRASNQMSWTTVHTYVHCDHYDRVRCIECVAHTCQQSNVMDRSAHMCFKNVTSSVLHRVCCIECVASSVLHRVCCIECVASSVLHRVRCIECVAHTCQQVMDHRAHICALRSSRSSMLHRVCCITCAASSVLHHVCRTHMSAVKHH